MATRILLVEDDDKLAALVAEYLQKKGYQVAIEARGDTAVDRILAEQPDLVILDIMLPGLDGLKVCKQVRDRYSGPILMLTALDDEIDEVVGLEIGADDYLAKPVRPRLLLAHLEALLRRAPANVSPPTSGSPVLEVGPLRLDASRREVWVVNRSLDLTTAEFDLLALLMRHAGETLSREQIYNELRGIDYDGIDRSIDLRIARLRKKIGDDA